MAVWIQTEPTRWVNLDGVLWIDDDGANSLILHVPGLAYVVPAASIASTRAAINHNPKVVPTQPLATNTIPQGVIGGTP